MFEALSDRFSKIFSLLSKKKNLTEHNIADALAEIRRALLDSDVAFEVVRTFIEEVKEKCIGQEVFRTVQPGQQVVKIVHDQLTAILGDQQSALNEQRPLRVMMVGLQGSGKTTTAAKLALWLKKKGERPALVACDLYRPAATEQLKILGQQIEVPVFAYDNLSVNEIAQRALADANGNASVLIFDTAGRLQIDQLLMQEVQSLKEMIHPQEILLVVDSALGQESVRVSQGFHASLGLTGIILTKLDGDAKGGAALSMKRMVNVPIKFSGAGEKVEDFEVFYPERMASRILGMGDIVSLVEKAEEEFSQENASKLAKKLLKGDFTFEDLLTQLQHTKKLDSSRISRLLPNMPAFQIKDDWAERIKHQEALVLSMTKEERQQPNLVLSPYRRARILRGSGLSVSEFNQLLKQFQQMKKIAKRLQKADPQQLNSWMSSFGGDSSFWNQPQNRSR